MAIARGKHMPASVRLLQKHLEVKESARVRLLHRARALSDAAHAVEATASGVRTRGEKRRRCLAVAPAYLAGRVGREEALPAVAVGAAAVGEGDGGGDGRRKRRRGGKVKKGKGEEDEVRRAVAAHVAAVGRVREGKEGEGATGATDGLKPELFVELLEYMVPKWDEARRRV